MGDLIRQQALKRHRLNPNKVKVIYNGVDCKTIAKAAEMRETIRKSLGFASQEKIFIFVGRISAIKNLATLLKASSILDQKSQPHHVVVVGAGDELPHLANLADNLGVSEFTHFLGERNDVYNLLAAADAFAIPSLSEGISMSILEAMAAGLPIIATKVGGNPELVQSGHTGYLVPVENPLAFSEAMELIINNMDSARLIGDNARRVCQEKFSAQKMVEGYLKVYAQALNR